MTPPERHAAISTELDSEGLPFKLAGDPQMMWREFASLFEEDIRRRIAYRFPAQYAMREDLYQEVCLKLVEDDFRRIRVYRASGSFRAYLMAVVDNIVVDVLRRDIPRRRSATSASRQQRRTAVRIISLSELLERGDPAIYDTAPNPEEVLIGVEEERLRLCRLRVVKSAFAALTAEQQMFLAVLSSESGPMPARRIARVMGLDVRAVYQMRRSVRRHMIRVLQSRDASSWGLNASDRLAKL